MRIFISHLIPPKGFTAINLFGMIFVRNDARLLTDIDLNHEGIHTSQGKELLWIFFYILYIFEFLFRFVQYKNPKTAYYNISFEREAYANQDDLLYRKYRKIFSFIKYYKKNN